MLLRENNGNTGMLGILSITQWAHQAVSVLRPYAIQDLITLDVFETTISGVITKHPLLNLYGY